MTGVCGAKKGKTRCGKKFAVCFPGATGQSFGFVDNADV
jgi:hypothetical protein